MLKNSRPYEEGGFYHVIIKGNKGRNIFFTPYDREYFYYLLNDGIEKYDHAIHAFCLMTNHVHLLIEVGKHSLSDIMHNLSSRYAKKINKMTNVTGHLLRNRFKSYHVANENYYFQLIRYIHRNPIRAHIVQCLVDYPWSSYHAYAGRQTFLFLTKTHTLSLFAKNKTRAKKRLLDLINTPNYAYSEGFYECIFELPVVPISDIFKFVTSKLPKLSIIPNERTVIGLTAALGVTFGHSQAAQIATFFKCHANTVSLNLKHVRQNHSKALRRLNSALFNIYIN